jgi:AcrR family transcriptional regulator
MVVGMEAATRRELSGEKAQRIVAAMRTSVGRRGAAGATFDHVAREAGVSRGLLHYYFGTKERLLAEVVRRDCDIRMAMLDAALKPARTHSELVEAMVGQLEHLVREDPGFMTLLFELFTSSRHNPDLQPEMTELTRRVREHLAGLLEAKRREGVIGLAAPADAVSTVLFSLADGLALRMLCETDRDHGPAIAAGVAAVRTLVTAPE